jgi:hypothetical protein
MGTPLVVTTGVDDDDYWTGGVGLYGETFGSSGGSGEVLAKNIGGRAKITLAGPLKLRVDYRVVLLGETPDATPGVVIHQHPSVFRQV